MHNRIAIFPQSVDMLAKAAHLSQELNLPLVNQINESYEVYLIVTDTHLACQVPNIGSITVDFLTGKLAHRKQFGSSHQELIAKAVGVRSGYRPNVIDATAGLARDAFVLACLGCQVTMIERSPLIAALVQDALDRAENSLQFIKQSLTLIRINAIKYLANLPESQHPDVIYLDPMFPERTKSALVKKEMRILKAVVGEDEDIHQLFTRAIQTAKKRVVIKRPKKSPPLTHQIPTYSLTGKTIRYDIYLIS